MTFKRLLLVLLAVAIVVAAVAGWNKYRSIRAGYDAYRTLIQSGARVAGIDVGWLSEEEARSRIINQVAEPYYQEFSLHYQDEEIALSPQKDLALSIAVDEMVGEAVEASHQYDYWQGLLSWAQGDVVSLPIDVPLQVGFDETAASAFLMDVATERDVKPLEPMVDIKAVAYIPGQPGRNLAIQPAATMINERVLDPRDREVILPVSVVEPDQSPARVASMLSTLGPVMEKPPTPPSFFTATLPISTTGGLAGTPLVNYTGELTWTFPHFISYTGHLTSTYGHFFDPGEPGLTFNITEAIRKVDDAVASGATEPIYFEPDLLPPPPITPSLLLPPLEDRLAKFPGVTSILVKDLDADEILYESNVDYVLSGMSIVKIGIMVDVYRHFGGEVDAETYQEMVDMLGSESCNPCANRLMTTLGGGSAHAGGERVTVTMRQLGLANFYLCAPFQVVDLWHGGGQLVRAAHTGSWLFQSEIPRYDKCVRATPREMAQLLEMIYQCSEDRGLLREMYPEITADACQEMIDIMAANDLRNMLGAGIPKDITMAHKHGFSGYDVPWGDTRGEVGIIFSPDATWLISFYIWEDMPWINWGINQPLYRDVSNMFYNYFNPQDPFWPLPPWVQPPEEEVVEDSDT
jgi:hypothetical protein